MFGLRRVNMIGHSQINALTMPLFRDNAVVVAAAATVADSFDW